MSRFISANCLLLTANRLGGEKLGESFPRVASRHGRCRKIGTDWAGLGSSLPPRSDFGKPFPRNFSFVFAALCLNTPVMILP